MSKRDYYEILNVARNASEAEIKQAFSLESRVRLVIKTKQAA